MTYSTLIFDLDGTLSDSRDGITRSINYALGQHGLPLHSEASLYRMIGPPIDATFHQLVPGATEADVTDLVVHFRDRYADVGYAENQLYDNIAQVVRQLRDAGRRLAVCTAKRVDFAERIIAMFDLDDCFAFIDGGEVGRTKSDQLADLLRSGRIDRDALMIGDRHHDIDAARANGLAAAGVLWGFGSRTELDTAGARPILEHVNDLLALQ